MLLVMGPHLKPFTWFADTDSIAVVAIHHLRLLHNIRSSLAHITCHRNWSVALWVAAAFTGERLRIYIYMLIYMARGQGILMRSQKGRNCWSRLPAWLNATLAFHIYTLHFKQTFTYLINAYYMYGYGEMCGVLHLISYLFSR